MTDDDWETSMYGLTDDEIGALLFVMESHYDNILEMRGDDGEESEYDQFDEDQASVMVFSLADWGFSPASRPGTWSCLVDAIWIALDNSGCLDDTMRGPWDQPDSGLDYDVLISAATKIGYYEEVTE